ncbi:putative lipid II flippase FtsW [archaeon]|nr:putative lipid II flippase FtsW [archaeon]
MEFKKFLSTSFSQKTTNNSVATAINNYKRPYIEPIDTTLLWSIILIISFGLIMVFSSSIAIAEGSKMTNNQPYFFVLRHLIFLIIGTILLIVAFRVPTHVWQKNALLLFVLGTSMLIAVLIPGIGKEVNGAQRWIRLGLINVQPSEFMKILSVLYASDYITRKKDTLNNLKLSFLPMLTVIVITGGLLLVEPDFGAFIVISFISFGILFLGGAKLKGFLMLLILAVIGFVVIILTSPYRLARVIGFLDPWQDPYGKGYQLSHSLIAFGRGEIFGVGLGSSIEKLFYLPEAHTDFLMAVIGEELGFFGVITVIILFSIVIYKSFMISFQCSKFQKDYERLVAQGMGLWFGFQVFINIGVNLGLLPTKGLTLPFMSFGGSSIVANMIAVGILLRIDWDNRKITRTSYDYLKKN